MVPLMVYLFWDQKLCQQFSNQVLVSVEPYIVSSGLEDGKCAPLLTMKIFLLFYQLY